LLKESIDIPGVLDILLEINRIRLYHSQRKLREKVYSTLKAINPSNLLQNNSTSIIEENYLLEALEYEELEKEIEPESSPR
jgi:hypothetical protein